MNDVKDLSPELIKKNLGWDKTSNLFPEGLASLLFFMFQYPYINLFISTLVSSTIMAISSSHWLIIWISLEINIISFIPILAASGWHQESEAALKYFIFQALGSTLVLFRILAPFLDNLILLGLIIKLGVAPFHYWFPSVVSSVSWPSALLLLTWQKLAPLILLVSSFPCYKSTLLMVGVISAFVGGLGGLIQTRLQPILAYSSVGHMGWMLAVSYSSPLISLTYLIIYITISIPIIWSAMQANIYSLKLTKTPLRVHALLITLPCILSLRGLPPFLGFFPKLLAILSFSSILFPLCLLLGSLINLSYYLNFFFTSFVSAPIQKATSPVYTPFTLLSLTWLATIPLPALFLFLMII